jgi:hypothetical protein
MKMPMVGAPKWLDSDKIDVEAKVGSDNMVQVAKRISIRCISWL